MIANNDMNNQLPKALKAVFDELGILKHLRNAGITKGLGFTCAYLFKLIFNLIFEGKNWYMLLESKKSDDLPEKNVMYPPAYPVFFVIIILVFMVNHLLRQSWFYLRLFLNMIYCQRPNKGRTYSGSSSNLSTFLYHFLKSSNITDS